MQEGIDNGEFIENAEFSGNMYGTRYILFVKLTSGICSHYPLNSTQRYFAAISLSSYQCSKVMILK